ncbi:MAG TPA: NAD(P)H-hydrate dehydratase [Herpetosiphonaceae bacterium]
MQNITVASVEETRQLEAAAVAGGVSWAELMERAGRGVAQEVMRRLEAVRDARILVLVGPGNNGGDGLVAARYLHDAGAKVALYIWKRRERADDQPWRACRERGIPELQAQADHGGQSLRQAAQRAAAVVDALLGMGVDRPLEPPVAQMVETINGVRAARSGSSPLVVAIDVPTGINADSGAVMGHALMADVTIATGIRKHGHLREPGRRYSGDVTCVPIGLPDTHEETRMAESLNPQALRALLPARPADSHKGTFGKVMVVAGAGRYPGAAFLTTSGALRAGVGLATLACGRSIFGALAASLHEATFLPLPEEDWGVLGASAAQEVLQNLEGYKALVVGPGLGREEETRKFLERLLKIEASKTAGGVGFLKAAAPVVAERARKTGGSVGFRRATPAAESTETKAEEQKPGEVELPPLVLDADGLNLLSEIDEWWTKVPAGRLVLTPHPGEMARLLKLENPGEVNADRAGAALRAAQEWQQIVVLKGAETVIAAPDGKTSIGPAGNPALATAGTGDVLAGVIGGLIAQGVEAFDAARLGVFLHAQAGQLVRREIGEAGAVAGDLLLRLPRVIGELRNS